MPMTVSVRSIGSMRSTGSMRLIYTLKPADRQVILMYLEGLDAASIGEITGMSSGNVATKVHRIKQVLARRFHEGETS